MKSPIRLFSEPQHENYLSRKCHIESCQQRWPLSGKEVRTSKLVDNNPSKTQAWRRGLRSKDKPFWPRIRRISTYMTSLILRRLATQRSRLTGGRATRGPNQERKPKHHRDSSLFPSNRREMLIRMPRNWRKSKKKGMMPGKPSRFKQKDSIGKWRLSFINRTWKLLKTLPFVSSIPSLTKGVTIARSAALSTEIQKLCRGNESTKRLNRRRWQACTAR